MEENKEVVAAALNVELKAMLALVFDGVSVGEDVIQKNYFSIIGAMVKLLGDAPAAVVNFSDLTTELANLPTNSAAQADLVAYLESQFASFSSSQVQAILTASLKMVTDSVAVVEDGIALAKLIA